MSVTTSVERPVSRPYQPPESFEAWKDGLLSAGVLPIVAVAGSRGKSTVIHLLDAIFGAAGLRTVLWTDHGVTLAGRKQRGELVPWTKALGMLSKGEIDVAVQELDWDTVHAVGLPKGAYPIVAVTNLCANNDACMLQEETLRAIRALQSVREAAHEDAVFVLNGDDWAVAGGESEGHRNAMLVTLSRDTPLVRAHVRRGGIAVWSDRGEICIGRKGDQRAVAPLSDIPAAQGGSLGFLNANLLTAVAVARACGIGEEAIGTGLREARIDPAALPGGFNVIPVGRALAIVDRPVSPWFLRVPLRAVRHLPGKRQVAVIGHAADVPLAELPEVGRLLGRDAGLVAVHGEAGDPERGAALLQGIAANDVPPVVIHAATESAALNAVLRVLRPEDVLYVVADDPRAVVRRLQRAAAAENRSATG